MNVLVIGNGFDLAHDLPTTYFDFIQFVKCVKILEKKDSVESLKQALELEEADKRIKEYLIKENIFFKIKNKEDKFLEEFLRLISNNVWIEYFESKTNSKEKKWIDFENEILQVIKELSITTFNPPTEDRKGRNPIRIIVDRCDNNFNNLNGRERVEEYIQFIYNHLSNLIRCLEIYISKFIEEIDINKEFNYIKELNVDKILSFNYSNTYNKIYNKTKEIEYDFIHGEAILNRDIEDNNMVLGIDEYLPSNSKDSDLDFVEFKKYYQRIYKETGLNFGEWINQIQCNDYVNNIYIIGHSLGITDKDILKQIINCRNREGDYVKVTIYYHNEQSHKDLIKNVIKIIGQDELKDRFHGKDKTIIFRKIEK